MQTLVDQFVRERRYLKNVPPARDYWGSRIAQLRDCGVSAVGVNTAGRALNAFSRLGHQEDHFAELARIPRLKEDKTQPWPDQ